MPVDGRSPKKGWRGRMRRGMKNVSVMAGLAVLGAMMTGGRAEAAPAKVLGISTAGGVTYNPDPQYTYFIGIYLDAGETFVTDTSIQDKMSITGITSSDSITSLYVDPGANPLTPNLADAVISTAGTLTINYTGPNVITAPASTNLLLAYFEIATPNSPSQTGQLPGSTVDYAYTIDGVLPPTTGSFVLQNGPLVIPEPSSLILMMIGGTVLPYLAIRERRRRVCRTA
jgi:hypothetical protein